MSRSTYLQLFRLGPAALAALFVSGAFVTNARAGCGRYVVSTWHAHEANVFAVLELSLLDRSAHEPIPPAAPAPRPCSGPSCSRSPLFPPVPPSISVAPALEPWGCFPAGWPLMSPNAFYKLADPAAPHPVFEGARLERPPRAA